MEPESLRLVNVQLSLADPHLSLLSYSLGSSLYHGLDLSLRFIAASIIWEMIAAGIQPELFLANHHLIHSLPTHQAVNELGSSCSNWIRACCAYIHNVDGDHLGNHECGLVHSLC
jgi:hypothetical protein